MFTAAINKDDSGWTLLEMLIVMAIIGSLFAISWAGFFGLRRTMKLHQAAESLRSDITYAQRSAMLIKRSSGETWIRGVGISVDGSLDDDDELSHRMFKWCSDSFQYVDFNVGSGFDDPAPIEFGSIITNPPADNWSFPSDGRTFCNSGPKFAPLTASANVDSDDGMDFSTTVEGTGGDNPVTFVVFEAVTGFPHFFRKDGTWINPEDLGETYEIEFRYTIGTYNVSVIINQFGEIYKKADV